MKLSVVGFKTGEKFEKNVKISFSIFHLSYSTLLKISVLI